MQVAEIWTLSCGFSFAGDDVPVDEPMRRELVALLTAAVLCNDATLPDAQAAGQRTGLGDPTKLALLAAAASLGIDRRWRLGRHVLGLMQRAKGHWSH
jgi:hypothetical protein